MSFKRKAVVFDLDGTLVHSVPDLRIAANIVLKEAGRSELDDDDVALMVGHGVPKLVERIFKKTGDAIEGEAFDAATKRFLDIYENCPMENTLPWPGVLDVLEELKGKGCIMGVCTNKPHQASVHILSQLGIDHYFSGVVGGDSTDQKKPHAKPLLATLEAMGVTPDVSVMVGDSPSDMELARNGGIPVIAIDFGYTQGVAPEDLDFDIQISSFDKLSEAIASLD